jgi:hypothetical protein
MSLIFINKIFKHVWTLRASQMQYILLSIAGTSFTVCKAFIFMDNMLTNSTL